MQEYPVRSIVSEPFVSQIEVIEKTLIEPVSQQVPGGASGHSGHIGSAGQQYYKYGNFYPQQQHQQHQQQPQMAADYYGYRQTMNRDYKNGGAQGASMNLNSINNSGLSGVSAHSAFGSSHSNGSSGSVNMDSAMSSVGSLGLGAPTHVPQVFDDKSVGYESRGLATFDPFDSKDYTKGGMFLPMFNSSNTILGSGFSGNSNIWGDANKTMASDAAVWG